MADYISNEELQKEEESGGFSLSVIWTIIVLNWQWILLSAVVALCLAYGYLRYSQPVYSTSMKVLIKDDSNKRSMGGQMSLDDMGLISNSNGFANELEILTSTRVNSRVVKSLKLYVMPSRGVFRRLSSISAILSSLTCLSISLRSCRLRLRWR